ncbi:hypothetical protein ACKKBF_B37130 [Auxenochlorella protothecoides x Auxenochlorella symbiontica]
MPPSVRNPTFLTGLVLLLTRCAFAATCSSTFVALPSAILGAHVYLTTVDSADAICKYKGFSKSGSIRTSTLNIMGLSMSAIRVSTLEIMTPRSTEILVAVECLKAGQKACTADSNGNIGSGNKGKNNFGTNNVGDDNIGNSNVGTANWGDANKGKGNRCFNKTGDRKIINDCSLLEFGKHALEVTSADCQAISSNLRQEVSTPTYQEVSTPAGQEIPTPAFQEVTTDTRQEVTSATRQEFPTPARREVAATALNPEPSSSQPPALTTSTTSPQPLSSS